MSEIFRRNLITAGSGLTLAGLIGLVRPAWAQDVMGQSVMEDAYSWMASNPDLTTWVQLIDAGGLRSYAQAPTPYTVFPAADSAFAQFPGMVKDLLGYQTSTGTHNSADAFPDSSKIVKLVRSHVVRGKHYANEVMGKKITVTSVAGTPIDINGTNPQAVVISWTSAANGQNLSAKLTAPPVTCVNAVVYVIDSIERM